MHWLLFIHKILLSSTCFEPQVLIFRKIQLYTCSIWYCHSEYGFHNTLMFFWPCIVNWLYTNYQLWCTDYYLFIKYYSALHVPSLKCSSSGGYSCIHAAYGTVTLYESLWWLVGTQLKLCTDRPPGTLVEGDRTICCMYTFLSSWRWALKARNM